MPQATPNFTISASPASLTITQGSNGTSTITITSQNAFSSATTLTASGLPNWRDCGVLDQPGDSAGERQRDLNTHAYRFRHGHYGKRHGNRDRNLRLAHSQRDHRVDGEFVREEHKPRSTTPR